MRVVCSAWFKALPGQWGDEPPHAHVRRDDGFAKFWLSPEVVLQGSGNVVRAEVRRIQAIVESRQALFLWRWDVYFNR